jgi:hypothetical protein
MQPISKARAGYKLAARRWQAQLRAQNRHWATKRAIGVHDACSARWSVRAAGRADELVDDALSASGRSGCSFWFVGWQDDKSGAQWPSL